MFILSWVATGRARAAWRRRRQVRRARIEVGPDLVATIARVGKPVVAHGLVVMEHADGVVQETHLCQPVTVGEIHACQRPFGDGSVCGRAWHRSYGWPAGSWSTRVYRVEQ